MSCPKYVIFLIPIKKFKKVQFLMKTIEDFTNVPRRNYNGLYFNELFQNMKFIPNAVMMKRVHRYKVPISNLTGPETYKNNHCRTNHIVILYYSHHAVVRFVHGMINLSMYQCAFGSFVIYLRVIFNIVQAFISTLNDETFFCVQKSHRRSSEKQVVDKQKQSINTTPVSKPSRFDAPSEESAEEMAMVNINRINKYGNQSPYK